MKTTKMLASLFLVLALLMVLVACGGGSSAPSGGGSSQPSSGSSGSSGNSGTSGGSSTAPADDGKVYTLRYASNDGTTVERHVLFVEVIKNELEARSNGRLNVEIYPSGTLARPGEVIDGLKNGTVDMGLDNATFYTGMYLYTDLICAAGFNLGSTERLHNTFLEYCDAFAETEFEEVILLCQSTTGAFGVYTNRAINTVADLSGLQCRVTANYIPFFEKLNISGIMMPSAEVYEGIRLGVIDSNLTNISSCTAFKLHEVTNYFTGLPMTFGEMVIVMSRQTYNALPQDLQAVIDETKAFICETWLNYLLTVESTAKTVVAGENPDFKWVDLPASELAKISELTIPMLQEKAAAMDAAGLDGSGAMAWLLAHSV